MLENRFNLVDEKWLPIVGLGDASLKDVFTDPQITALGGVPRQKVAILKLLFAIAQAAVTPVNNRAWQELGSEGLSRAVLAYLGKHHDKFYLYGEKPFLQMPVGKARLEPVASLQPEVATGNNPRLTHLQCGSEPTDADRALLLVTEMSMCLGGKRGDKSVSLDPKLVKRTAPAGPGTGFQGYLHNFLTGKSILETVWLNLWTLDDLARLTHYEAGLGVPPWEEMPQTETCEVAQRLQSSLQGRLVPMARFCLFEGDGVHFTEGIAHKSNKDGMWDPSVAAGTNAKGEPRMLWVDPEKRPWRSLSSLLSFISSQSSKDKLTSEQLKMGIERLRDTTVKSFGVWSGGLRVSSNSGQQYVTGMNDQLESEIILDRNEMLKEEWFGVFAAQMEWLDLLSSIVWKCVKKYYDSFKIENNAQLATRYFWEKAEEHLSQLLDACVDYDEDDPESPLKKLRKEFIKIAYEAYDAACPAVSPKQLQAWAENRPRLKDGKKVEAKKKEKQAGSENKNNPGLQTKAWREPSNVRIGPQLPLFGE